MLGFATHAAPLDLRPIVGIVGAALIGDAIALPSDVTAIALPPGQQYALASRDAVTPASVLPISADGAGPMAPISGAMPQPDRIEFSPSGSFAVLYSKALQKLQVIGGLPDSPGVSRELDASGLTSALAALAVSDDGQAVLAGTSGGVALMGNGAVIWGAGTPSALRFVPATRDAVLADSQGNQIVLLANVTGTVGVQVLATGAQGVSAPADLRISPDKRVFVANSGTGNVLILGLDGTVAAALDCGCTPGGIAALGAGSVYLLSDSGNPASWLFDIRDATPALRFLPALNRSAKP